MAVDSSALTTVLGAFGIGGAIVAVLKWTLDRVGKHVDAEAEDKRSETAKLVERTNDLFTANQSLRKDMNEQLLWFQGECASLRTQLREEREHSRKQDEALEACERRSDECDRKYALQTVEIVDLKRSHEELSREFADSEESRRTLRALLAAVQVEMKKSVSGGGEAEEGTSSHDP